VQSLKLKNLLPIKPFVAEGEASKNAGGAYSYEPDPTEIMDVLLPLFLNVQIYHAMLEVGASEHAARMTAMDNATNACKDMIKESDTVVQ
jgi:F-type H+-transporting ATPase subunit gamma